jgi:hypothetical protein
VFTTKYTSGYTHFVAKKDDSDSEIEVSMDADTPDEIYSNPIKCQISMECALQSI